ncbi:MAG: D-glycerate dehydrogenase [Patescibacteria group bacterium]
MAKIFVTRRIPAIGLNLLKEVGHEVVVSEKDGVLTREELNVALAANSYDAILSLLSDTIDDSVLAVAPQVKIVANYAVGYNNIDIGAAKVRGVVVTNTPGVLTDTVAEFTIALMLAAVKRIPEADRFTRAGRFEGWAPELFLGSDVAGKTLGILGAGRIGCAVATRAEQGLGMKIIYNDIMRAPAFESQVTSTFKDSIETVLREADVISIHVPLLPSTNHLITAERLSLMKPTAYLINTSRGAVIDEQALVTALKNKIIRGAGLDVFEYEPAITKELLSLDSVVLTPHIASGSEETRNKMSAIAAQNIVDFFATGNPQNPVE